MKYVFGPVTSRRLGQSLGIDPVPLKTCNWNCVYCQLGRSVPMTNERKDYYPRLEIWQELHDFLDDPKRPPVDWISIVGSGEPLLMKSLGWLIERIKETTEIPVALITNGSLFFMPEMRQEVLAVDAILPSVDAGSPELYKKLNRPHPQITFERCRDGLIALRKEYKGQLWPEVVLVQGINDSQQALEDIASLLSTFGPDQIHLNVPQRPPAEGWVGLPGSDDVERAVTIFEKVAPVVRVQAQAVPVKQLVGIKETIISIVSRHPVSDAGLRQMLGEAEEGEVERILQELKESESVKNVERNGTIFWCAAASRFVEPVKKEET